MASEKITEDDCFSIKWSINNFSYCWQKLGEYIASPSFIVNGTKYQLLLFPRGFTQDQGYIILRLCRENDSVVVKTVDYMIQFLASDGSKLDIRKDQSDKVAVKRAIIKEETKYLPQDILTLRCIISSERKTSEIRQLFARTIINVETMSHLSSIENFNNLQPYVPQCFLLKSKDIIFQVDLFLAGDSTIFICIDHFDQSIEYFKLKTFILDSKKYKHNSGEYEYWWDSEKISELKLNFTKSYLTENKNIYLPNDALTLNFEFTVTTGLAFNGIEKAICESASHPISNGVPEDWRKCFDQENIADFPSALIADLTSLQKDKSTCDMNLQTKTNIYPVHTLILSARSPVFKEMFSKDMKETLNGCTDVSDLDDETVRRFLFYMYTNQLEDLEWEDAFQLYTAAVKYGVISLKNDCSTCLKCNLHSENVCKILTLSDLHQDKDLKVTAQYYVLKNAKEILRSKEWKLLVDTYPKLAVETMSRNWIED